MGMKAYEEKLAFLQRQERLAMMERWGHEDALKMELVPTVGLNEKEKRRYVDSFRDAKANLQCPDQEDEQP